MRKNIFLIFIMLLFPLNTLAVSEVNYDVTKYNIEANIESNGNVNVCEYIKLTGSFNGYVRDIFYKEGDETYTPTNINNISVYDLNTDTMSKGDSFTNDKNAVKGDALKYYLQNSYYGPSITMFNENYSGSKGFVLCYTLENAILIHNDVAELYYNFIPKGFSDLLEDVTVKVNLNKEDKSLRVWAHGALYGNVTKKHEINNSYLLANINYVNPGEVVNIRMTFDKNIVNNSNRFTNKDALDEIIEEETKLANIANKERKQQKLLVYGGLFEFFIYVGFVIFSVIYCYAKYDKEHKVNFNMEYYRDFPGEYGPEILEYLIKKRNTTDSYSASILNMVYKKNITILETEDKKDYILKKAESFSKPLLKTEGIILDFIINDIGNGKEVTLKEIKKYGKNESSARKFFKHFESWKNEVKKDSEQYNFYENDSKHGLFAALIIIFAIITFLIGGSLGIIFIPFVTVLIGVGSSIYILTISKRTKSGMLEYKKWMSFKKFLLDFGRFDEKELPEIVLWEKYLVYATVFGIAEKLEKTMKIKIQSFTDNDNTISDIMLMNYMIRSNLNQTMHKSISTMYNASRSTIAASSNSSGSGSGGGFSGGGSFSGGGGGGGGHGF